LQPINNDEGLLGPLRLIPQASEPNETVTEIEMSHTHDILDNNQNEQIKEEVFEVKQ
jgi:hypothetical protein